MKQCSGGTTSHQRLRSPGGRAGARSFFRTRCPGGSSAHLSAATGDESAVSPDLPALIRVTRSAPPGCGHLRSIAAGYCGVGHLLRVRARLPASATACGRGECSCTARAAAGGGGGARRRGTHSGCRGGRSSAAVADRWNWRRSTPARPANRSGSTSASNPRPASPRG